MSRVRRREPRGQTSINALNLKPLARSALMLLAATWLAACPATTSEHQHPRPLDGTALDQIRIQLYPYDLRGDDLEDALVALDEFIAGNDSTSLTQAAYAMRADAHLDLWIYGQVAAVAGDPGAQLARDVLGRRVGLLLSSEDWEALDEDERADTATSVTQETLPLLAERLSIDIGTDYQLAGVSGSYANAAARLLWFDLQAPDAAAEFATWRGFSEHTTRLHVLLVGLFYTHHELWIDRAPLDATAFFESFAWLCSADPFEEVETLAAHCGFWCAALPADPIMEAEVERPLSEAVEDDTPPEDFDSYPEPEELEALSLPDPMIIDGLYDTPGDIGYELVSTCGADYFGLPDNGHGPVLLSPINFVSLVFLSYLGETFGQLEAAQLEGDPLVVLSASLLAQFRAPFEEGRVPQQLTPAALAHDTRLHLPTAWCDLPEEAEESYPVALRERIVSIRSNGIYVSLAPSLQLRRNDGVYSVGYFGREAGFHYPGQEAVEFVGMYLLPPDAIADGRLPALEAQLTSIDALLGAHVASAREVSILADGDVPVATVQAVLRSLAALDYGPIYLHLYHTGLEAPIALPIAAGAPEGDTHSLVIAAERFHFSHFELSEEESAFAVSLSSANPRSTLYRHILEGMDTGGIDETLPLMIRVDTDTADFGLLAHLVNSLAYRRGPEAGADDRSLLAAPLEADGEGLAMLFEAGIWLQLTGGLGMTEALPASP